MGECVGGSDGRVNWLVPCQTGGMKGREPMEEEGRLAGILYLVEAPGITLACTPREHLVAERAHRCRGREHDESAGCNRWARAVVDAGGQ